MRLEVVEEPGPRTIVLEIGLVEVVPTKAWLAAVGLASWALPLAVGIPIGTGASLLQPGSVAIEGTLRDAETGELIAAFADRERSKARVVDLQALTWYGHAREIFMDWASQLLQLLTTPNDRMVRDSAIFDPLPF